MTASTIRKSYIELRGINLGAEFVRENELHPGTVYSMVIVGIDDGQTQGTLDKSGFIGGLTKMYREFDLAVGDTVGIDFDGSVLMLTPPQEKLRTPEQAPAAGEVQGDAGGVFKRKRLNPVFIEPFAPGNLSRWNPRTEPDVYMVFGVLSEYTDYRYVCGASKELLTKLGYTAETKPDAVLIDKGSDEYRMAEFKVKSSDFNVNHQADDVDVLICWIHDEADGNGLPREVLALKTLLEELITDGNIDL